MKLPCSVLVHVAWLNASVNVGFIFNIKTNRMNKSTVYVRQSGIKKVIVHPTAQINVRIFPAVAEKKNFFGWVTQKAQPITYDFGWYTSETPNDLVEKLNNSGDFLRYDEAQQKFYRLPHVLIEFNRNEYQKSPFETDAEALEAGKKIADANNLICITN